MIQNNKLDFLQIGRQWGTKIFLPAANFHRHELQVLVKYTPQAENFEGFLGKLT